jgi:UDP-N-acetylmuramyl pentapeptide phosphotransferase/UDP-N-acetylglucosamine-1-phosphate transferase
MIPPGGGRRDSATMRVAAKAMPCLLLVLLLAFPRIALVLMFFYSTYLQRAYHNLLVLALGFVFLPLTTIVYAWLLNSHRHIDGVNALILIVAVIVDVCGLGGGEHRRRGR